MRAHGNDSPIGELSGPGESVAGALNRAKASIALAILFAAIFVPFVIGRAGTPRVLVWPMIAGLAFVGGPGRQANPLVLCLAALCIDVLLRELLGQLAAASGLSTVSPTAAG